MIKVLKPGLATRYRTSAVKAITTWASRLRVRWTSMHSAPPINWSAIRPALPAWNARCWGLSWNFNPKRWWPSAART